VIGDHDIFFFGLVLIFGVESWGNKNSHDFGNQEIGSKNVLKIGSKNVLKIGSKNCWGGEFGSGKFFPKIV
jgi:hypothetical protein